MGSVSTKYPVMYACQDLLQQHRHSLPVKGLYMSRQIYRRLLREVNRWGRRNNPEHKRISRLLRLYGMEIKIHTLGIPIVFVEDVETLSYMDENGGL